MASDVIKVVERVFAGAPMRAAVDERTNSLVLSGPDKGTLEHARALLSELDRPLEAPDGAGDYAVQSVVLKAADAREVSDHLEEIAPRTRGPSQVRFVADARANTVWVAGSEKSVGKFVALANEMDATTVAVQGALAEGRPELHFHKLQHADARMVCGTINQVMKTMAVDVEVVPDAAANMLIAFAGSTEQDLITRIISELDIQAARQTRRGARGNLESTESDKSE
jgi:hypothetical protein